jgi:hypothetical protein
VSRKREEDPQDERGDEADEGGEEADRERFVGKEVALVGKEEESGKNVAQSLDSEAQVGGDEIHVETTERSQEKAAV